MRKTFAILSFALVGIGIVVFLSGPGRAQPATTQPGARALLADADATAARIGAMVPVGKTDLAVPSASTVPVTFDGHVSKFEYGDATHLTFPNNHGTVDVFIKVSDG